MTRRRFFALFAIPFLPLPAPPPRTTTIIIEGNFIGTQKYLDEVVFPMIRAAADTRDLLIFPPKGTP
jgi:hypothetical protein